MARPQEYSSILGNELIELMASGLSLTAAAAELGFHRQTMYDWENKHPEFSDAIKLARGKRVLKLERDMLGAVDGPVVTARIFALKNADPKEWRDRQEITGKDGGAIKIVNLANLSSEQLIALEPVLAALTGPSGATAPGESGDQET